LSSQVSQKQRDLGHPRRDMGHPQLDMGHPRLSGTGLHAITSFS